MHIYLCIFLKQYLHVYSLIPLLQQSSFTQAVPLKSYCRGWTYLVLFFAVVCCLPCMVCAMVLLFSVAGAECGDRTEDRRRVETEQRNAACWVHQSQQSWHVSTQYEDPVRDAFRHHMFTHRAASGRRLTVSAGGLSIGPWSASKPMSNIASQ